MDLCAINNLRNERWRIGLTTYVWSYDTNSNFTNEVRISDKSNIKSLVISADPIRRETCNPAGDGFCRIVKIRIAGVDIRPSLVVDFLLVIIELFSLHVTAELRLNMYWKSPILKGWVTLAQNFR